MRKPFWKSSFISLCAGVLTGLAAPSYALQTYTITDLGTLGGTFGSALGINDSGLVVGNSTTANNIGSHAFLHNGSTMADLGTLVRPWGELSAAYGVNNAGQIVGLSDIEVAIRPRKHAFLYSGSTMLDLGTLGGRESAAYAINNAGQVVGESRTTQNADSGPFNDTSPVHAFLYSHGRMFDIGTLGGTNSQAYGINNAGYVVGASQITGDAATRAFVYHGGRMVDIGTLGGSNSGAYAVNDARYVVGSSDLPGTGRSHAFLYDGVTMKDLGTLGGSHSIATAINNAGQVVGDSLTTDAPDDSNNPTTHAFLFESGKMHDLNTLPEIRKSGWILMYAQGINNNGQIIGRGIFNGQMHAFLLAPCGRHAAPIPRHR